MRKDMAKVIVTRARILEDVARKGRSVPDEIQPKSIGLRRHVRERGASRF